MERSMEVLERNGELGRERMGDSIRKLGKRFT